MTSVSSAALTNAMRYQQMRMQADLVKATKESSTGRVADVGLALGGRTAQSVTFSRDLDRLNVIVDSNGLVTARLASTQTSLGQLSGVAQTFLSALTTASSGDNSNSLTQSTGQTTLQQLTSILNTSVNGEYLFAGTNTDVKPINDFTAAGSPAKAAFDASFVAKFGFTPSDPAAANITAAQMDDFITNDVAPQFLGAGWQTNMSNATDQQIVSRIALTENT
jgi:flagellar hook-associated protein 3 FlgL